MSTSARSALVRYTLVKVRIAEVRVGKPRPTERGADEDRAGQFPTTEVNIGKIRPVEDCARRICRSEPATGELLGQP